MDSSPSDPQVTLVIPSQCEEQRRRWTKVQHIVLLSLLTTFLIIVVAANALVSAYDVKVQKTRIELLPHGFNLTADNATLGIVSGEPLYLKLALVGQAPFYHPGTTIGVSAFQATVYNAGQEVGSTGRLKIDYSKKREFPQISGDTAITFVAFAVQISVHRGEYGFDQCQTDNFMLPLEFRYFLEFGSFENEEIDLQYHSSETILTRCSFDPKKIIKLDLKPNKLYV